MMTIAPLTHAVPRARAGLLARRAIGVAGLVVLALPGLATHAARPLVTDDAAIVDPKACQLETWVERTRQGSEYWALPACNFTGNLELTLGAARAFGLHEGRETKLIVQGKTIFRELEPNGWGLGLVAGAESPVLAAGRRVLGDLYAHVPVSASLREGRTLLHANLGWAYDRPERRHNFTWGAAGETQVLSRTWLLAESFGQQTVRPFYQVGMRHWIVPDRLQIDATYGNRFGRGSEERRFSIGLAIFTAAFLP